MFEETFMLGKTTLGEPGDDYFYEGFNLGEIRELKEECWQDYLNSQETENGSFPT
jgi:hypothetical protein